MRIPDWMLQPLVVLGITPDALVEAHETRAYDDWLHSIPRRSATGICHAVDVIERLHEANLLNVDVPAGPVEEREVLLVRGLPTMVKMIQERRLILELPLGRKFRRKWDWRKATEEVV